MGWLAIAAVAAFPTAEGVRTRVQHPHVALYGDQALLDLGARRAARLEQLVGPYSRSGFHHPGPAVFYLLAPFVRVLGPGGAGMYLGAVVINGAALIAAVAVLWRRLGPLAAVWAAAAIDVFCLCMGVGTLREPWNPYLVVAPMIAFVVLWSAGVTGSLVAAMWALVVGSYEVQTHIATAPLVLAMATVLVVIRVRHRPPGPHRRWAPAGVLGAAALVLLWIPPVIDLVRDRPNNAQLLWDFFTSGPPTTSLGQALHIAADAVTIMPFGNHDYVLALHRGAPAIAVSTAVGVAALMVAVWDGRRRREPMSTALASAAGLGFVIGGASLTHADGPVYLYFVVWLAFVPLSIVLALGAALVGGSAQDRRVRTRAAVTAVCVVVLVAAALTVRSDLRMGPVSTTTGSGPWPPGNAGTLQGRQRTIRNTTALTQAAESVLRRGDRWVALTIESGAVWPYAAGMVLGLDERGVQSTVGPAEWSLYFGHERLPGHPVAVVFRLYATDAGASSGTVIADLDGALLTYERTSLKV